MFLKPMFPRPLYQLCPNIQSLIEFNIEFKHQKISCVGHEWYCSEKGCNCRILYLIIFDIESSEHLTSINYGWKNFDYYVKERFTKEEAQSFTKGSLLMYIEPETERNKAIVAGFQNWLSVDRFAKNKIFEDHYQKFISRL